MLEMIGDDLLSGAWGKAISKGYSSIHSIIQLDRKWIVYAISVNEKQHSGIYSPRLPMRELHRIGWS